MVGTSNLGTSTELYRVHGYETNQHSTGRSAGCATHQIELQVAPAEAGDIAEPWRRSENGIFFWMVNIGEIIKGSWEAILPSYE